MKLERGKMGDEEEKFPNQWDLRRAESHRSSTTGGGFEGSLGSALQLSVLWGAGEESPKADGICGLGSFLMLSFFP